MNYADSAIQYALAHLGYAYRRGAAGPDGFEGAGLVYAAYRAAGLAIPRSAARMKDLGHPVRRKDLLPGDLVFPGFNRVQLYIGGGKGIEATRAGGVRTTAVTHGRARRITSPGGGHGLM